MAERRRRRLSFKTPLALIVLLALLGAGAYGGYRLIVTGRWTPPPDPCVTVALTELQPANVIVRVYNGGSIRGRATEVSSYLKESGFIVTTTANTDEPIHDTVIVGVAEDSPEVLFVQSWFAKSTVRADGRADHSVDVLVGEAGGLLTADRPASWAIPSGQVCVPPSGSPQPSPPADEASAEGGSEAQTEGEAPA
ncbi:MAG: LytR C-terminal domain-containing protein [Propionibacteriaceae bacterium]|nr:LytR C-terminal domain-containing protein [Propionibacteriaceae bacterium]